MKTQLNPRAKQPQTVEAVAAQHGLQTAVSANGNLQFKKEPLQHLYELAVSTLFGKDTFYQSGNQLVSELRKEVREAVRMDALDFVANLAIHARTVMNIRTIPIVMVVEFARELREQGKSYANMRTLVCDVIQRADQITDLYAYSLSVFGDKKRVPAAIKRGTADAFNKFNEYAFAKYNRDGGVKMRDVLRIVHPKAKDYEQGLIYKKIMEEVLDTPYTWEVELSKNGQLPANMQKSKAQLWSELYLSGKMGYMAQLRNLRNLVQSGADSFTINQVAEFISDPARVLKSKQLPFDFVQAYKEVAPLNSKLGTAISKAIDVSVGNMPVLGKRVVVITDFSGSMGHNDENAIVTATLMSAALLKANESADNLGIILFGDQAKAITGIDTNNSVLAIQQMLIRERRGAIAGYTNFEAALDAIDKLGFVPDTVVVFTDGEINRFPYRKLVRAFNKDTIKVVTNLNATASTPFISQNDWFSMAGWGSAMFQFIPAIRNKSSIVDILSVPYNDFKV